MRGSLKFRIFILILIIFSTIFSGMGVFLYYQLQNFMFHQLDDKLKGTLHTLSNLIILEDSLGQLEMELWELSHVTTGEFSQSLSGHYYQISSLEDGNIMVKSPSLSLANKTLPIVKTTTTTLITAKGPNNETVRLVSSPIKTSSGKILVVEVGNSLRDTYILMRSFRNVLLVILPITFLIITGGTMILTSKTLKPIQTLSDKISRITDTNLSERIEEKEFTTELRPLVRSFNTMIGHLEEAFVRQRQFLSDASHELRTPTTIIKSYCDITLRKERSREEYKSALERIHETVNRMCQMINRILVISRLDNKTLQRRYEPLDLKDLIGDAIKLIEPSIQERAIKVNFNVIDVIKIRGDREGLMEVFTNLIENAVKYNIPHGQIDIELVHKGKEAIVSIRDTGIGIPQEELSKIFDRFYRVYHKNKTPGSGLGLSIAKAIVDAHGGSIKVTSMEGEGSVFEVHLPA